MKKTVKKGAVMEEKITEIFINGKNTVAMSNIDQFKRHIGSAFHGIFVTTSGTKAAVTTERDKFKAGKRKKKNPPNPSRLRGRGVE